MLIGGRTFDQRRRNTDEGHICYYVSRCSSPALVAIPGSFGDAGSLGKVVGKLDPDLSLLIVELRGHGNSSPPPRNGSIEQFATDVLDTCCAEGLKDFYVTGSSIGGMVALEMGSQRPHLVKGIIAIEGWTRSEVQQQAFDGLKVNTLLRNSWKNARRSGRDRSRVGPRARSVNSSRSGPDGTGTVSCVRPTYRSLRSGEIGVERYRRSTR